MEETVRARKRPIAKKSSGIRRCIYCGYEPKSISELTEEHIVPRGVGGRITIANASCKKCEKITNRFETICLKTFLLPIRRRIGVRPRHAKANSPDQFYIVEFSENGQSKSKLVTPDETSVLTTFPLLLPAIKLLGTSPHIPPGPVMIGAVTVRLLDHSKMAIGHSPKASAESFVVNTGPFCLMLAKIAHCFLIAALGENFVPFLPAYITGELQLGHNYFVGCHDYGSAPTTDNLHILSFFTMKVRQENLLIVEIRLFCAVNIPTYRVVGGLLTEEQLRPYRFSMNP